MSQLARLNKNIFNDFFGEPSSGYFIRPLHGDAVVDKFKVDIKETEQAYVFHAELPGVKKEDLHITIDGDRVTIGAEVKQFDQQSKEENVIRSERYYGSVSRSFQLPVAVDENSSEAKYQDGILDLTLTKKVNAGSKRIQVK